MKNQIVKRGMSSLLAIVLATSSIATYVSHDYKATNAGKANELYYSINQDQHQKVLSGELPHHVEIQGTITHDAFDNNEHVDGVFGRKSLDYTVSQAYQTTEGKVLYPGEQMMCIDHWTKYGSGGSKGDIAVMQSYGLSFMMGNFAAKWLNFNAKIPREPRLDLLTNNTSPDAYRPPDSWQGSNGDTGGIVDPIPPGPEEVNDYPSLLSFATKTEGGKVAEISFVKNRTDIHSDYVDVTYAIIPANGTLKESLKQNGIVGEATAKGNGDESYTRITVQPPKRTGNEVPGYYVIPYVKVKQNAALTSYHGIASKTVKDLQIVDPDTLQLKSIMNDPKLGPQYIDYTTLENPGPNQSWSAPLGGMKDGSLDVTDNKMLYFWMGAPGSINHTYFEALAKNNRVVTVKDYRPPDVGTLANTNLYGIEEWTYKMPNLHSQHSDLKIPANASVFKQMAANVTGAMSAMSNSVVRTFSAAQDANNFKNIPGITLNTSDYAGRPFATAYKGSSTAGDAGRYEPLYSMLSAELYNFYSHNNLFSHLLNGTPVPRYFSGSGIGAKTAVANQKLQGSTDIDPFWGWSHFKAAHGTNFAFCGNIKGEMPNGRSAKQNADRLMLLAEYINNKMTRDVPADAMKSVESLPNYVNNRDTFESAMTWNTDVTMKWNDPQDIHKMFHFAPKDFHSFKSSYTNASFIATDSDGNTTKTSPDNYIVVGPFYAHTDYPESRLKIGFTENVDVGGLAKAGDEVLTSTTPDGKTVADYVILTSEAIIENNGNAGTDRRKSKLYPAGMNTTTYANPVNEERKLMQSWEVVNGNVPLTKFDLGDYTSGSPHEVVKHEPTYWDGTTTDKDIYDAKLNGAMDPKFMINNWGKGEFYVAVRRTANNRYPNSIPQITIGYELPTGTLTQTSANLKNTDHHSYYQGFALADTETVNSSSVIDLELKLANISISKTDKAGVALDQKAFYLYRLADLNPQLPETDPNRFKWVRYVPVNANMPANTPPDQQSYYPHLTDTQGKISFEGLIPGWYMLFEKVDNSFRKVSYLQTNDPNEPERRGIPIDIERAGFVGADGVPYKQSVTLPQGARGKDVPIDDPLNQNKERAGDIFYVDDGLVKGINMEGAVTMKYNVYSGVINDPVIFYKRLQNVGALVGEDGRPLNLNARTYEEHIQFVFQAEEDKGHFYVATVKDGEIKMRTAKKHTGSFPAEDQWIDPSSGEKMDKYWWIDSSHVRIEEHINPASGISKKQIKQITQHINTGRYDHDLMKYSNMTDNPSEFFENKITEIPVPLALRIKKTDAETGNSLAGAAFTLYCPAYNIYAKSDAQAHNSIENAYLTNTNGELLFYLEDMDSNTAEKLKRAKWVLTEVEAPPDYIKMEKPKDVYFRYAKTEMIELHGKQVECAVVDHALENIPEFPVLGELTVTKDWYVYQNGAKQEMADPPEVTFRLYKGKLGDRTKKLREFTLSENNKTFTEYSLELDTYWIEEVNVPEGMSISYSPSQEVDLTKENPKVTIKVENTKTEKGNYQIALAKKKSLDPSVHGTGDDRFSTLPFYEEPAQFKIEYNGPEGTWETTVTYDNQHADHNGYMVVDVPYKGAYTIREINTPNGYVPEIKISGTGVDWYPFGPEAPFGFQVPDDPNRVSLYLQIVNNHPTSFTVIKRDRDDNSRIWDADMELTMYEDLHGEQSGKQIGIAQKMGEDGEFFFSTQDGYNFEIGDWVWLVETNPPKDPNGVAYKPEKIRIQITEDIAHNNHVVEMFNELPKSNFKVIKKGPNEEPVQGATFDVFSDQQCKHFIGSGEANAQGEIDFSFTGEGPFYVRETYVPDPYVIDQTVHTVTPSKDNVVTLTVTNKKSFKVIVLKEDADSGAPVGNAEFALLNSVKEPMLDEHGVAITGKSDATGVVIWNNTGTSELFLDSDDILYLRETGVPDGYFEPEGDLTIDLKNTAPEADGFYEGCYVFTAKNNPIYGIRIKKTEILTPQPATPNEAKGIEGITFKIYNSADTLIATKQTDRNGVIELKNLPKDTYYAIEELPPDSIYKPNPDKIPLTIMPLKDNGDFASDAWGTYNWVQNERKKGSITLIKEDDKGTLMKGVTFGLYKYEGNKNPLECKLITTAITDGMGQLKFEDLELGKYWIVELSNIPTYVTAEPKLVEIKAGDNELNITTTIVNNRVPASLKIIKQDNETSAPIAGVKFTLSDGVVTMNGTTDSKGEVKFYNLERGKKYVLTEVEAPDGYFISNKPLDIVVGELDNELTITLVNSKYKGKIEILKVSEENGKPIKGAKFILLANGTPVGEPKETDMNGLVTWENLTVGAKYEVQEVFVPKPYILDDTKIPVDFTDDGIGTVTFKKTVSNRVEKWFVRLWKIDAATSTPLTGAEFDLYAADKITKINTTPIKVGSDGMSSVIEVPKPGKYYFKETKAPDGFVLDERFFEVIAYSSTAEPQICLIENRRVEKEEYYIELHKIDGNSKVSLSGAEFTLYDSNRVPIESKTTGKSGVVIFKVDKVGTYYVRETKPPTGYNLIQDEFVFNVEKTQAAYKREVPNYKDEKHLIKVLKKDKDSNAPLGNAVFEVFDAAYQKLGELQTTLPEGSGVFEVSKDGTYYLKEKVAPEGYTLIDGYIEVIVGNDVNVVEKTIYNERPKEYSITVYKKDKDSNAPLADATFDVYASDKKTVIGTVTTTLPNGSATIKVPAAGKYYLKEVQAPAGYVLINGFIEVDVNDSVNVVEKTIYNEKPKEYSITIYKKDKTNNAPLADATFNVFASDKSTLIGTVTTTLPNGSATIRVPSEGTYYLKEVQAPEGYVLVDGLIPVEVNSAVNVVAKTIYNEKPKMPDKYFITIYKKDKVNNAPLADATFEIYDTQNKLITTATTALPNGSVTVEVPSAGTYFLKEVKAPEGYVLRQDLVAVTVGGAANVVESTIYNEKAGKPSYVIKVYKKDKVNNAPLSDAVFGVYDENKDKLGEFVTTLPDGSGYFEVRNEGTYYLKELEAPRGFKLLKGYIPVTVNSNTNVVESTIFDEKEDEVYNTIKILKKDQDGSSLGGVKFGLYNHRHTLIETKYSSKDGTVLFENLDDGTYFVREEEALPGYIKDNKEYTFKLSDGETKEVEFVNVLENENGQLSIRKYITGTNTPLPNAEFSITSDNGYSTTAITDSSGSVLASVPTGTYIVKETKAPEGYVLDSAEQKTVIQPNETPKDLIFYNKPANATIAITKIDAQTKVPLSGAKFGVFTLDEQLLQTAVTDSNGHCGFTLPYGNYILREVEAPVGYMLDVDSAVNLTLDGTKQVVDVTVTNTKVPVPVVTPKTGFTGFGGGLISNIVLPTIAIVSGILLVLLNRKELKNLFRKN